MALFSIQFGGVLALAKNDIEITYEQYWGDPELRERLEKKYLEKLRVASKEGKHGISGGIDS